MKSIETEIVIQAPAEQIWNVLTGFEDYSEWNPFITSIGGSLVQGKSLEVTMEIEPGKANTFNPLLLSVIPRKKICWRGKYLAKWIFQGTHYFILEKTDNGETHFIHGETFSGIMVNNYMKRKGGMVREKFIALNKALKERAENN